MLHSKWKQYLDEAQEHFNHQLKDTGERYLEGVTKRAIPIFSGPQQERLGSFAKSWAEERMSAAVQIESQRRPDELRAISMAAADEVLRYVLERHNYVGDGLGKMVQGPHARRTFTKARSFPKSDQLENLEEAWNRGLIGRWRNGWITTPQETPEEVRNRLRIDELSREGIFSNAQKFLILDNGLTKLIESVHKTREELRPESALDVETAEWRASRQREMEEYASALEEASRHQERLKQERVNK